MTRRPTRLAALAATLAAIFAATLPAARLDAQGAIDFEGLGWMENLPGQPVPAAARLADHYLASHGVRFTSAGQPFVAVVTLGVGHATSGTLGVGGVTALGRLAYDAPFFVDFFHPADPSRIATTESFSIRNDRHPVGGTMRLRAFDVFGTLLGAAEFDDRHGTVLTIALPGMHRVEVRGTRTTAFDDLAFGPLSPAARVVPEPTSLALAAAGIVPLAVRARRRR